MKPCPVAQVVRSFKDAWSGLRFLLRSERNIRIHLWAAYTALGLAVAVRVSVPEVLLVLSAIALVTLAEAFNTALEQVISLLSPQRRPRAAVAKHVAAAAVLLAAGYAALVALLIFGPRAAGLPAAAWRTALASPVLAAAGFLGWLALLINVFLPRRWDIP